MLINIMVGLPTMAVCLVLEALLLVAAMRFYVGHEAQVSNPSMWASMRILSGVMMILVIGNIAQVGIWALLFQLLGEFSNFNAAFYHSAVNFATLGYGDIVMSDEHKLLGPLEAINGVLMIGVSTAVLMTSFQDALKKTVRARRSSGAIDPD